MTSNDLIYIVFITTVLGVLGIAILDFPVLLPVVLICLSIVLIKRRVFNSRTEAVVNRKDQKLIWDFGYLDFPLRVLFLIFSILFLSFTIFGAYKLDGWVLSPVYSEAEVVGIKCYEKNVKRDPCWPTYYLRFTVDDVEYMVSSGTRLGRPQNPSPLFEQHAQIGDTFTLVYSELDPTIAVLEVDLHYYLIKSLSLLGYSAIIMIVSSTLLLKKLKHKRSG